MSRYFLKCLGCEWEGTFFRAWWIIATQLIAHDEILREDLQEAKSTMGTNAEEEKMVIVRFGDLQIMRRVRTGKRLLMKKKQMVAAAEAEKSLPVSPTGGPQPLPLL
ncbi:hypothetical protein JHK85_023057 [Glycine max]|nr:hypothetical protein JHK85_023057 [Glycine max]